MWLEERIGKRVNLERMDEALGTGADVVSTACPYCLIMLDDAVKERQRDEEVSVMDIAQVLERSMAPARLGAASPASPQTTLDDSAGSGAEMVPETGSGAPPGGPAPEQPA